MFSISPAFFWPAGFLSLSIPLIILFHIIFLIINVKGLKKGFFFHVALIILGFAFIKVSYSISRNDDQGILKVLSYNVRVFNNYVTLKNKEYISSKKMIGWARENDAPVKCFQEFYNNDKSDIFNVKNRLIKAGWKHQYFKVLLRDRAKAEFGIAIYSKLPIIKTGEINSESGEFLNSIFVDILVK